MLFLRTLRSAPRHRFTAAPRFMVGLLPAKVGDELNTLHITKSNIHKMRITGFVLCIAALIATVTSAVLGIDFGQEFVKSSLVAPGAPFEIVLSADSKRKETAGITFKAGVSKNEVERVYSNAANNLFARFPATSPFYTKLLLGKSVNEADTYHSRFPAIDLVPASNNRSAIEIQILKNNYTVEELVAMQFEDIRNRAGALLASTGYSTGSFIRDVAITVPPHFSTVQRRALEDAVDVAGLKLISLVNDGVAVAVNFASTRSFSTTPEYYVIYDAGAGSITATLVSIKQGDVLVDEETNLVRNGVIIDVHGVGYEDQVGGQLFTERIRELLLQKFAETPAAKKEKITLKDLKSDHKVLNKFWREAERVKNVLSANSEASTAIESVKNDVDFKSKISREEFETSISDLKDRIARPLLDALTKPLNATEKPLSVKDIKSVILAGGSTRVPIIQQLVVESLGGDSSLISKNVNADEAGVLGATLRGVGISKIFRSKDMKVTDRTIWDHEISYNGQRTVMFPRGTVLGTTATLELTTDEVMGLFENGQLVENVEFTGVRKALEDIKKDTFKECINSEDIKATATFQLGLDGIVKILDANARCLAKEKPRATKESKASTDEVTEVLSDDTSSATSTDDSSSGTPSTTSTSTATPETETPPKIMRKSVKYSEKYPGIKPFSPTNRGSAISRLRSLSRQDSARLEKERLKNDIESLIYQTREYLVSNELGNDHDLLQLESFSDWLYDDADNADATDLSKKVAEIIKFREAFIERNEPVETTSTPVGVKGTAILEPAAEKETGSVQYEPGQELLDKVKEFQELVGSLHNVHIENRDTTGLETLLDLEGFVEKVQNEDDEKALLASLKRSIGLVKGALNAGKEGDTAQLEGLQALLEAREAERQAVESDKGFEDKSFEKKSQKFQEAFQSVEVEEKNAPKTKIEHKEL